MIAGLPTFQSLESLSEDELRSIMTARYNGGLSPICATVFNGASLPGNQRLTRLAVLAP